MTLFAGLNLQRVYLDVNVLIYAVEKFERFQAVCNTLLSGIDNGTLNAVTSELSLAEALVYPIKQNKPDLAQRYDKLVQSRPTFEVVPVSRLVLQRAAEIRAIHGNKLPDAIHIATASLTSCSHLITADGNMKLPAGLLLLSLNQLIAAP